MSDASAPPSPFSGESFALALQTSWLGRRFRYFHSINSTNDHALALPDRQAVHGLIVLADEQTAGRGRLRRAWVSSRNKGLLFSFVLRGESYQKAASALTFAASVGVHRTLVAAGIGECEIRWPNDIVIGRRKVCGILVEAAHWTGPGYVVGIGLNVNQTESDFPAEIGEIAASMGMAVGHAFLREPLMAQLAFNLEQAFDELAQGQAGIDKLRREWDEASCFIGRTITIDTGAGMVEGMAVGLEENGGLILRQISGFLKTVHTGSVVKQ